MKKHTKLPNNSIKKKKQVDQKNTKHQTNHPCINDSHAPRLPKAGHRVAALSVVTDLLGLQMGQKENPQAPQVLVLFFV